MLLQALAQFSRLALALAPALLRPLGLELLLASVLVLPLSGLLLF